MSVGSNILAVVASFGMADQKIPVEDMRSVGMGLRESHVLGSEKAASQWSAATGTMDYDYVIPEQSRWKSEVDIDDEKLAGKVVLALG